MSSFKTKDNVSIYYKDWGTGKPVVFSHGWPLSADEWEAQMFFLASKGYRAIAHDRRGHGRSEQPWEGYDMDTFADDLAQLIEKLDLKEVVLVGHSMGGGEVSRYIGRHGTKRISKIVLIASVTPSRLKTDKNPGGLPLSAFDATRANLLNDRSQFFQDLPEKFFSANREGTKATQGMKDLFWYIGMQGTLKSQYDCVKAFSETDFTEDLKKMDVPVLIIHGDDDQIVSIDNTAKRAVEIIKNAELKVYKGGDHGLPITFKSEINNDLLTFIQK